MEITSFASQLHREHFFLLLKIADLLFLESSEVIFRVAIAMLEQHKDELMKRDNFEEIMDYMKNVVPQIDPAMLDKVMREVFTTDIQKQLTEYQVEYNVLQEEISTTQHYMESLNREKESYSQIESKLQVHFIPFNSRFTHIHLSLQSNQIVSKSNFSVCRIEHYTIGENSFIATNTNSIASNASAKFRDDRRNARPIYAKFVRNEQ